MGNICRNPRQEGIFNNRNIQVGEKNHQLKQDLQSITISLDIYINK